MNLQGYAPQQGTNSGQSMFNLGSTQQRPQATNYQKQFMNNGGQPSLSNMSNQGQSQNRFGNVNQNAYQNANQNAAFQQQQSPMTQDQYMQQSAMRSRLQPQRRPNNARDYRRMMMERARRRYMMQNRGY